MYLLILLLLCVNTINTFAQQPDYSMEEKHFIYTLKLKKLYLDRQKWTAREHNIAETHFDHLKKLTKEGKAVLAGRTLNKDETQFGIVILKAASEQEARSLMENDPAVKKGLMTAELYPFRIATQNGFNN